MFSCIQSCLIKSDTGSKITKEEVGNKYCKEQIFVPIFLMIQLSKGNIRTSIKNYLK